MAGTSTVVTDNAQEKRYEIHEDGELAGVLMYRVAPGAAGDTVALLHTETLDGFTGRGIAGRLVEAALDDLKSKGATIVPLCPYVVSWLGRHPEYRLSA